MGRALKDGDPGDTESLPVIPSRDGQPFPAPRGDELLRICHVSAPGFEGA